MSGTSKKKKIEVGSIRFKYAENQPHTIGNSEFRLFPHQANFFEGMLECLEDNEPKFFFLESMTGSGKTIANITPAIEKGDNILVSYPTNQLIKDQKTSIDKDAEEFDFDVNIEKINSKKLRIESQKTNNSIVEIIDNKLRDARDDNTSHIFLTTPDTLYNILTAKYWTDEFTEPMKRAQNKLLEAISYLVFDEFHMYDMSMETSILNMCIILHNNLGKQLPIVFSSATSDRDFKESLSEISRNQIIKITDEKSISDSGVTISGNVELEVVLGNMWDGPETFAEAKNDEIIKAINEGGDLTAIFESVKRTSNTISRLREEIPGIKEKWAYSTGIEQKRVDHLEDAPLVIGTRTLSVGIDFDTQNLFFESYRARDFLQKFGRVARGEDDGISKAMCYTSEYSFPGLDEMDEYYENKKELQRDLIENKKMAKQGKMWGYKEEYGPVELYNMWEDFAIGKDNRRRPASHAVYGKSPYSDEDRRWLGNFLMAFRNPGVPQVAIADRNGIQLQEVMMFLEQRTPRLREHEDKLVQKKMFLEKYSENSPIISEYIQQGTIEPLLFYEGYPDKDTSGVIKLRINRELSHQGLLRYPKDIDGIKIIGDNLHGKLTREIADRMSDRNLLTYIIPEERFEDLYIPHLFKMYELEAAKGKKYQVAFGQNALKLNAYEKRWNN